LAWIASGISLHVEESGRGHPVVLEDRAVEVSDDGVGAGRGPREGMVRALPSGGLALVGAPLADSNGISSGAAYVFDPTTGQQLFELVPDDGAAWLALGRALAEADDRDAGVSMLRRLLRGRPYEVPGRVALGRLLVGDGAERAGLEAIKAYAELLDVLAARIGAAGEREPEAASRVAAVSEEPVDAGRTEGARA